MKLTEAPPSTQSISSSDSARNCASESVCSRRIRSAQGVRVCCMSSPGRGQGGDHDRVAREASRGVVVAHRGGPARGPGSRRRRADGEPRRPSLRWCCRAPRPAGGCAARGRPSRRPRAPSAERPPRRSGSARPARRARRCAARSPNADRATGAGRPAAPPGRRQRAGGSNSEASATPSPVASFSSTTAVGLLPPRSIREIIERLTPQCAASASSDRPRAARSSRTRWAMRSFRSLASSVMLE